MSVGLNDDMRSAISRISLAIPVDLEFAQGNAAKTLCLAADTIVALREEVAKLTARAPEPEWVDGDALVGDVFVMLKEVHPGHWSASFQRTGSGIPLGWLKLRTNDMPTAQRLAVALAREMRERG